MAHEDGSVFVRTVGRDVFFNCSMQKKIAREAENPSKLVRASDSAEERYCSPLGETAFRRLDGILGGIQYSHSAPRIIRDEGMPFSISALMRELK